MNPKHKDSPRRGYINEFKLNVLLLRVVEFVAPIGLIYILFSRNIWVAFACNLHFIEIKICAFNLSLRNNSSVTTI